MFRITRDLSSGISIQCLTNYSNGSIVSVDMDVVDVMAAYLLVVRVCTAQCREALCVYCTVLRGTVCALQCVERQCVCTAKCREALCVYCTV